MQTAAVTNQAALTASPLLRATIANATAPRRAIAIHKILFCSPFDLSTAIMDVLLARKPEQNKCHPRDVVDQGESALTRKSVPEMALPSRALLNSLHLRSKHFSLHNTKIALRLVFCALQNGNRHAWECE